jgi:hypothetical protein
MREERLQFDDLGDHLLSFRYLNDEKDRIYRRKSGRWTSATTLRLIPEIRTLRYRSFYARHLDFTKIPGMLNEVNKHGTQPKFTVSLHMVALVEPIQHKASKILSCRCSDRLARESSIVCVPW